MATLFTPAQDIGPKPWTEAHNWAKVGPSPTDARPKTIGGILAQDAKISLPSLDVSFADLIDVINPLQHVPVLGSVYRAITGDKIGMPERVVGGGIYFGVFGAVAGLVSGLIEKSAGQDPGEMVISWLTGADDAKADSSKSPAPPSPSTPSATAPVFLAAADATRKGAAANQAAGTSSLPAASAENAASLPAWLAAMPKPRGEQGSAQTPTLAAASAQTPAQPSVQSSVQPPVLAAAARNLEILQGINTSTLKASAVSNAPVNALPNAASNPSPALPATLPPQQIPEAMSRALELYAQRFNERQTAQGSEAAWAAFGPDQGLDSNDTLEAAPRPLLR